MCKLSKRIVYLIANLIIILLAILTCNVFLHPEIVYGLTFNKKESLVELSKASTYYLYKNGSNSLGINDYFTFEGVAEYYNESSDNEIIYRSESICIGTAKYNADYYAIFKMSDSLYSLAKQGLVNITAYSNFYSPVNSSVRGDAPDKITMTLASATSVDKNLSGKYVIDNVEFGSFSKSISNQQKSYAISDYSITLNSVTDRYLVLRYQSDYSSAGIRTTCNYMNVKNIRLVVSYKNFLVDYNDGRQETASYGTRMNVDFPAKEGYEPYKCLVNGVEQPIENNKVSFVVNSNVKVEFLYREILQLDIENDYYYNDDQEITLNYITKLDKNKINFKYSLNGVDVENITKLGEYLVEYSYSDDNYVLNGSTKINVLPRKYELSVNNDKFVYDGSVKQLSINNPRNFSLKIVVLQNGVVCEPINAGVYSYNIEVDQYGYYGNISGEFEILKQSVDLEQLKLEPAEYNGGVQNILYNCDYAHKITYIINDAVVQPINAGNYLCVVEIIDPNYDGKTSFNYQILKRKVVFSAGKYESVYGEDLLDIKLTITNALSHDNFNPSFSTNLSKNAGSYTIIIDQILPESNYEFVYEHGEYIVKKKKAIVTPSSGQSKMFGEKDVEILYSVDGLIGDDKLLGNISREGGENAGNYLITLGTLYNSNYDIEIINEYFKIYPQKMVVFAKSYVKVYGENDPSEFEYEIVSSTINNYQLTGKLERVQGEDVGVYNIQLGTLKDPNINIILVQGQLEILPKNLTVIANSSVKKYGDKDVLTYSTEGLIPGDELMGDLTREPGEGVGCYSIELGTLFSKNYKINFVPNKLQIEPKDLVIKAKNITKIYGEKDPELIYYSEEEFNKNQVFGTLIREKGENVGEYLVTKGSLNSRNYNIIFEESQFKILPKNCVVYMDNYSKIYGEKDPIFSHRIDGIINNDIALIDIYRDMGEECGKYEIKITDNSLNYSFEFFEKYYVEILKSTPIINVDNIVINYNGNEFVPNAYLSELYIYHYTYNGKPVDSVINSGEYEYFVEYKGDNNTNPTISNTAKITVNKLMMPITFIYTSFIYDGNVHEPIYVLNNTELQTSVEFFDLNPEAVGEHRFKILCDNNNYSVVEGTINILSAEASSELEGISIQLIGGYVSNNNKENIKFSVSSINNNSSIYELSFSNQKIVKSFKTNFNNLVDDSKFCVEIDSVNLGNNSNLHIYAIDDSNNLIEVQYKIEDGIISFETENANLTYIITAFSEVGMNIYQIIVMIAMLTFSLYLHFISRKFIKKVKVSKRSKKAKRV